ncbi:MAG: bifunctional oligoribonuclease/PAP phosphatase NrnA [Patescibacteria group bacterium]|jgi:phosphoesterase RecJ-like protein
MNHLYQKANQEILRAKNIFLATHINPDGDAISSLCAMAEYLEGLGKKYTAFCQSDLPANYNFIPHFEKIKCAREVSPAHGSKLDDYDLVLVFDCATKARAGLGEGFDRLALGQKIIEFDHHPKGEDYADLELRDQEASSTTEIVYSFFKANSIPINRKMATSILTGIITDTESYLFPSATKKSVKIGSEMLSAGASHARIIEKHMKNKSLATLKTWGRILSGLAINKKYNIAVTALTYDDFRERNIPEEEYDGLSAFLSNLAGVSAILFLREAEPGKIRGSLRTSGNRVDVSKLAAIFGGGGHRAAAGFTFFGRLEKTGNGWRVE